MSKTHWKKLNNPDYLGAYALNPGEDLILTIERAGKEAFTGTSGKKEDGLLIHFRESDAKPMICNSTNAKAITKVAGTPYVEDWKGVRIALYSQEVSAFGETVDALRVRPFPPKEDILCAECGSPIKATCGKSPRQLAAYTEEKYGKELCADCATRVAQQEKAEEAEGPVNENDED
ncbi:hypothetical protein [Hominibacterium faecale]|uniref:Uncharacterized protein n=1 Tax=Hominibacterium faecale TaxID=2839743 RepID=A0A9J6QZS6_9FIRM|nr:hypothetical protein [Hominibacterium faecale]MCU7381038.1 hypothetical protein [Hominibacterium faecale]